MRASVDKNCCKKLNRDTDAIDVMPMYSELAKDSDFTVSHAAGARDEEAPGTSRGRARVRTITFFVSAHCNLKFAGDNIFAIMFHFDIGDCNQSSVENWNIGNQ